MRKLCAAAAFAALMVFSPGCGLVYQAASGYRANKMTKALQPGLTMSDVHKSWGEPDIRTYSDQSTEIWSYAKHANSNDMTAALLYTSAKEGDTGSFLDLKFVDGKLVSWSEAQHTMPPKESGGFRAGLGTGPNTIHY